MATLTFINQKLDFLVREGTELLQLYRQNVNLPLTFGCCNGKCGTCCIKIQEGEQHLSKLTKQEKETLLAKGLDSPPYRLACQCAVLGNVTIEC